MTEDPNFTTVNELYQRIGLGRSIGFGRRPAVLVIDLQRGFADPLYPTGCDIPQVITATNEIIALARVKRLPVIFTVIGYEQHLLDAGLWPKKIPALKEFLIGSPLVDLHPQLDHRSSDLLIVKKYTSGFYGTCLNSTLTTLGVDTLIICGCSTSGCVRATVVDALQYGYRAIVPLECTGDRASLQHQASLFDIASKYGDVVALDGVKQYLRELEIA